MRRSVTAAAVVVAAITPAPAALAGTPGDGAPQVVPRLAYLLYPPVPANSGSGRRVIYDMGQMRVWLVNADGTVVRTHPVSGHKRREQPGVGQFWVYSRSRTTAHRDNPNLRWEFMVRFAMGVNDGLAIGFHSIPLQGGRPIQGADDLGQALSSGCVRQAREDAEVMWAFAQVGTKVVVVDSSGTVPIAPEGALPPERRTAPPIVDLPGPELGPPAKPLGIAALARRL
jgi:lipoprotein-anchoring transpeptidase ErfK/SrfK